MMVQIYANYGVLAHEKQIIFTANAPHRHAKVSDKITVEIPEEYQPHETTAGEIALHLPHNSWDYLLSQLLGSMDRMPALTWFDGRRINRVMLRVVESAETLM